MSYRFYTAQSGRTHWRIDTKPDEVGNILVQGGYTNKAQGRRDFRPLKFGSVASAVKHYEGLNEYIGGYDVLIAKLRSIPTNG